MKLLAMVTEPASVARYLAGIGEPADVPDRSPSRGPPYGKSAVLPPSARAALAQIGLLPDCAAGPTAQAKLAEAETLVAQVKAQNGCSGPALADAESALEYARYEARRDGQAFASVHPDIAVEKARTGRAACRAR
jgi:hypothetical protein